MTPSLLLDEKNTYSKDGVARVIGASSFVFGFCIFSALLITAPLIFNWLSDTTYKFAELQSTVKRLQDQFYWTAIISNNRTPIITGDGSGIRKKRSIDLDETSYTDSTGGGTAFIRWGRLKCPETSTTTLIYNGIVGLAHRARTGGGANYLCLPFKPQYAYTRDGFQTSSDKGGSILYGVEYKMKESYPFKNFNNNENSLHSEDVVCSLCHVRERSVNIMIPAWKECPKGWTQEYVGYLMSSQHDQRRTSYICVDEAPDAKQSGENTEGASYLTIVEGGCGALPCPDYTGGHELTCVVCTI